MKRQTVSIPYYVYKCVSIHVYKCVSIHVYKCVSIHVQTIFSEWVTDCSLMPTQQFYSYMMMMMWSVLF